MSANDPIEGGAQEALPFLPEDAFRPKQPEELYRLRIVYHKRGRLALLSHLEVLRAMERTVRRAGLPFAVTQGFSPHMKTSFGSALPVGVGGWSEMFDVFLTSFVDVNLALDRLRQASVADLMVESCEYVDVRSAAPNVQFPISVYEVVLDSEPGELQVPESVTVVKKGKERNLVVSDYLLDAPEVKGCEIAFSLVVRQTGSLRPDVFTAALLAGSNAKVETITRVRQMPDPFSIPMDDL